jgi:thiol-disulfide isomerase/thioredoxin
MRKILLALLFVLGSCVTMVAQDLDSLYARDLLTVGTVAPDLTDVEGQTVSLEKYRGQYVVLDFWASWCPDCRKDMPQMKELYTQDSGNRVQFLGISFDTTREALDNYLEKEAIAWPQVTELKKMKESKMAQAYHIKWIPSIYLLDPNGKVLLATVEIEKLKHLLAEIKK